MSGLSSDEKTILLIIARQSLNLAVGGKTIPPLDLPSLPATLRELGSSFVTLTIQGALRGCIGSLVPMMPLAEDVREHAIAAALNDYRFSPVMPAELPDINIEVSVLTVPKPLTYDDPEQLPGYLRPGIDGVVLKDGVRRATFLPQVWEKLPDPVDFLSHLCLKMGASPNLWMHKKMIVEIYQVEEFQE